MAYKLLVLIVLFIASAAQTSACTFSSNNNGLLKANPAFGFVYSNNPASVIITTVVSSTLIVDPVSSFADAPSGVALTQPILFSGALGGFPLEGSPSAGYTVVIEEPGNYILNLSVDRAWISPTIIAGNYTVQSNIHCNPN